MKDFSKWLKAALIRGVRTFAVASLSCAMRSAAGLRSGNSRFHSATWPPTAGAFSIRIGV